MMLTDDIVTRANTRTARAMSRSSRKNGSLLLGSNSPWIFSKRCHNCNDPRRLNSIDQEELLKKKLQQLKILETRLKQNKQLPPQQLPPQQLPPQQLTKTKRRFWFK